MNVAMMMGKTVIHIYFLIPFENESLEQSSQSSKKEIHPDYSAQKTIRTSGNSHASGT